MSPHRFVVYALAFICLLFPRAVRADPPAGVSHVLATADSLVISGTVTSAGRIAELQPYEVDHPRGGASLGTVGVGPFSLTVPRFDGPRDRLYSAFVEQTAAGEAAGQPRFVEEMRGVARNADPYPQVTSKKGLQVADVRDALALGIRHAGLNVWLNGYLDLGGSADSIPWQVDGHTFHFRRHAVEQLDQQVKTLSDAGVVVTFILLAHRSGDPAMDRLMLHPAFDPKAPNGLSAFNVVTPEGTEALKACFEFLADRYCGSDRAHGRVMNFIVGNEVDSHWEWYNLGHTDVATVAEQYARAVRLCHTAVRKFNASGRVFLSLDHFWNMHYPARDATQTCAGRELVERLHDVIVAGGDFDWAIAYHPYPENLFQPRFWRDKSATFSPDTPRITFKNIEMLPRFLAEPRMQFEGHPRHVILSEQGFHTPKGANGEAVQAAAFAYAYYRIDHIPGIDAFILHRQIDHPNEGGLHLGLWWDAFDNPHGRGREKKQIYDVFKAAGTDQWRQAFEFALPIVGLKTWDEAKIEK